MTWRSRKSGGMQYDISCYKVFNDTSEDSLAADDFVFYPRQLAFINFTEAIRLEKITKRRNLFACMPERYDVGI